MTLFSRTILTPLVTSLGQAFAPGDGSAAGQDAGLTGPVCGVGSSRRVPGVACCLSTGAVLHLKVSGSDADERLSRPRQRARPPEEQ